ncbi:unnamed protein product, partial [Lymnaea stagnalis]
TKKVKATIESSVNTFSNTENESNAAVDTKAFANELETPGPFKQETEQVNISEKKLEPNQQEIENRIKPEIEHSEVTTEYKDRIETDGSAEPSCPEHNFLTVDNISSEKQDILPGCTNNEKLHVDDGGINEAQEHLTYVPRPKTLPSFTSLVDQLKTVSECSEVSKAQTHKIEDVVPSTANVSLPGYGQKSSSQSSGVLLSPAVVEDPNTPMSRTSPSSPRAKEEVKTSPTAPTKVLEEKSPSLLAQEALARMQVPNTSFTNDEEIKEESHHMTRTKSPMQETIDNFTELNKELRDSEHSVATKCDAALIPKTDEFVNTAPGAVRTHSTSSIKAPTTYPINELEQSKQKTKNKIGPMALSELLGLYYNPQLANMERFVDDFIQRENKKEQHEFYEILSGYFRSRNQLLSVEEDIKTLQKNYGALQKELWIAHIKTLSVQGQCADQARVYITHTYEQCQLIPDVLAKVNTTLENIRSQIADNLSLFAYTSQISKLQVESYIHNLYLSCPVFRDIPKNAPIPGRHEASAPEQHDLQRVKDCISILFMFHRKPISDAEFVNNIRQWTVKLISSLLRVSTFSDHLFILNHLLRCPAGVGKWSVELVQMPSLKPNPAQYQSNFGCPALEYIITAMATVLLPVKAREEFMCHMRINLTEQSTQEDRAWILVDSDGEEVFYYEVVQGDPMPFFMRQQKYIVTTLSSSTAHWLRSSAVFFKFLESQCYLNKLKTVLSWRNHQVGNCFPHTGSVDYDIRRSTEPMMIRLFSLTTVLIQLIGKGLATYSMARYRQLNKRLGRLIRQTMSFVSDHWLNFKTYYGPLAPASIEGLQIEFDQLFMRATYSILTAQKLGSWQFMADMPYTCVSLDSMWQLLWVLHQGQGINLDHLPPVETCKSYLQNPDSWQQLADNLMHMPTSEAIYLLTTFANMAGCRSSDEDGFIHMITLEVFEIAYISNHTREFCSKVGRELLSSIIQTHPMALSFLLTRVKEVMDKLGKMALYLFSELPISIWQPTDPDMLTLRQWILNFDLTTVENQLAQTILAKLNWDVFEETGRLVVDIRFHRQMALLLVEAYTRFISDKKAGFFIMEGMKSMAAYITSAQSPEQKFNNWAWDVAIRLKLHQQSVKVHSPGAADVNFQPPALGLDTWLLPLQRAINNKTPIACFVAITMTNIGHDITTYISEGLELLSILTSSCQYTTAIHVLGCVVPLFIDAPQYLLENQTFCQILQTLLAADESLIKSTKSTIMAVEFPGIVTQQLTQMIQAQVTSHLAHHKADQVISFWLKAIFKVCKYFTDRNSCYVADTLIRWSFVKKGVLDIISDIFKENYKKFCAAAKSRQGLVTSVFSWIANSNTLPSYMDTASFPDFPWLAYMILFVEGEHEVNTSLWQSLIMELHAPSRPNIDNALKAAVLKLQLEQSPSSSRLTIYRWAQQALDTPFDHPLLPILWQRFFALYLGRQVFETNIAQRASVGERFFESTTYNTMMKRMRKRLTDTSAFHMDFDPASEGVKKRKSLPGTPPASEDYQGFDTGSASSPLFEESVEYTSSKEFHQMLARLYQTYKLWLEEPRLHDGNLYLPALPPQYEASRLNQVFQGFMGPWLEFMDLEGVQYNLSCLAADWKKRLTCLKTGAQAATRRNTMNEPGNATERIQRRLRRYDQPKNPPPVPNIQSAVPLINPSLVEDKSSFIQIVKGDLEVLVLFTKLFSDRQAHHCSLDYTYIELIPTLYSNVTKTASCFLTYISLMGECKSKVNPMHRCMGPAIIPVTIEVKELNEIVQRRLEENRAEYNQVMIESVLPPAPNLCIAAVHTENAITMLIKQHQSSTDNSRIRNLNDIACHLFFHLAGLVCDQTDFYPPTRQFLASCIEILGQHFISQDATQTNLALQLCLDKPSVAGLVSPHFVPNSCPDSLVGMYGQLLQVLQSQNLDLVFTLLSKFNISQWLTSSTPPSEHERKRFVETLGSAIMSCGAEPKPDAKLVYGLYMSHLTAVLESNFPSNLYMVLHMILQGRNSEQLHTQVWEILLKTCFSDRTLQANAGRDRAFSVFNVGEIEASVDSHLSTAQVKELLDWLSSYFMHTRMNDSSNITFGLYTRWGRYVPYISMMIGALTRSLITKIMNASDVMSPYQIMELLWQPLVVVVSPWLQPLLQADGTFAVPWVETDDGLAVHMVSTFRTSVLFIYQQMSIQNAPSASGVLSLLLMYYMTAICTKTTRAHLISVFVSEVKNLPWEELRPDLQLLETMTKVKEVASSCCFSLIGHIMPHINWPDVNKFFGSQAHPEVVSHVQAGLAVLLIQCYPKCSLSLSCLIFQASTHLVPLFPSHTLFHYFLRTPCSTNQKMGHLLSASEQFDWSMVTQDGFSRVCNWFLQLCDAKCVLAERSSRLALGLRLLKKVSGFYADVPWSQTVSIKRETYLHCVAQQLCHVTFLPGINAEVFGTVLVNTMSEIEAIETAVPTFGEQEVESVNLLKEILSLLNNSNPDGPWLAAIMTSMTSWLRSSPYSLLLVPCMKAASRSLASLRQMSIVVETGIEVYFVGMDHSSSGLKGWPFILTIFQIPELNQAGYVQDSLAENAFLVLYAYLQHKLPFCQKLGDELLIMEEILDWTNKAHPRAEDEAKIILWWHLLLRLVVRQVELSPPPLTGTVNILSRFTSHLNEVGQERTGKGLLGVIGLGQKS